MHLSNYLGPGSTELVFTAVSPATNSSASCRLVIHVLDKEPPNMSGCPKDIEYKLAKDEYSHVAYWTEPQFADNVGVVGVYKSRVC